MLLPPRIVFAIGVAVNNVPIPATCYDCDCYLPITIVVDRVVAVDDFVQLECAVVVLPLWEKMSEKDVRIALFGSGPKVLFDVCRCYQIHSTCTYVPELQKLDP